MTYSSYLANDIRSLVLDTSVLINLHESTYGLRILNALPNNILIPEIVAKELEHETSKKNGGDKFVQDLSVTGKVQITAMSDEEYKVYETLVSGQPSLDDGEAATIAISACRRQLPVVDERKGRSKALDLCPDRPLSWSLDLLLHPKVTMELGTENTENAVYLALRHGRMRIDESHCDYVVGLIGIQRSLECTSLPGFKIRQKKWQENL